jgi:predicted DNA-binding protein
MPATSPRFTITVKPETDRALKRLAAIQGRPTASIIREYLEGVTPVLGEIADAMEAVRDAEASARAELVGSLSEVHDELLPHIEGIMGHFRAIASLGEGAVEDQTDGRTAAERGAARPTDPEGQPPLCNTGVVKSESGGNQPFLPVGGHGEI